LIQLSRVRTTKAVPAAYRGPKRLAAELKLLKGRLAGAKLDTSFWKGAKKQLRTESGGKCAYCEGPSDLVTHGDVEHFRPKAHYWWIAYCYDNYLYACQICNQVHKGENFPLANETKRLPGPTVAAGLSGAQLQALCGTFAPDPVDDAGAAHTRAQFEAALASEGALLPHPYLEDPSPIFAWEADEVLKEVRVKARSATPKVKKRFGAAETFYGLNRQELLRWRWDRYKDLVTLKDILDQVAGTPQEAGVRPIVEQRFTEMIDPSAKFAAMARFFVREKWGFAHL
jgi:hypothetical protein